MAVISRPDQAEKELHQRQPEQDADHRGAAGQPFGQDRNRGKADRSPKPRQHTGMQGRDVGAGGDQDACKPHGSSGQAGAGQAFVQKDRRQQDHPDRRGELQRKDLGQRDQTNGQKPQVLAGEMHKVAQEVAAQVAGRDLGQLAAQPAIDQHQTKTHDRADHQHFKGVMHRRD